MIETFIAAGEVFTGVAYIFIGFVFINQARYNTERHRHLFRLGVALLFIVGGLEELGDSLFTEGSSTLAITLQALMTLAQVLSCSFALWFVRRAQLLTKDYASDRYGA